MVAWAAMFVAGELDAYEVRQKSLEGQLDTMKEELKEIRRTQWRLPSNGR